jgi:nucleoside-diphosphate-sugar epimerase
VLSTKIGYEKLPSSVNVFPREFYPIRTVADVALPIGKQVLATTFIGTPNNGRLTRSASVRTPPVNRAIPLDISRAGEALGWKPEYSLSDAFADYIADMKAQMS